MRIFTICNKSPWPANEGGSIAMNSIIEGLIAAGHSVKVLAVNSDKYTVNIDDIPVDYVRKTSFETTFLRLKPNPVHAFLNLFSKKSYNIQRFISKEMEQKIIHILKENTFDIVNLEMLHTTPYIDVIRQYSDAKIVLRAHNIEHLIWERIAASCGNPLKRFYINHLASTLKRYELDVLEKVDGIAAITPTDGDFFRTQKPGLPVADIPFGVMSKGDAPVVEEEFPALFHLGSMNWIPNSDGIRWFLDSVWPLVHNEFPDLKLYLAGRHMPDWLLQRKDNNVVNVGEVDDARAFMHSKPIMIVPLLSGSGIRIKIIEGMQEGRTIISTTIGAEGIQYNDGEDLLIADTPEQYVDAIRKVINDRDYCRNIGSHAVTTVMEKYENSIVTKQLLRLYNSLLKSK